MGKTAWPSSNSRRVAARPITPRRRSGDLHGNEAMPPSGNTWERRPRPPNSPPHLRQCMACGREFASRKTAGRHKCPHSKVVHKVEAATGGQESCPRFQGKRGKPSATFTHPAPPVPSNWDTIPAVTGDLWDSPAAICGRMVGNLWLCGDHYMATHG